MVHNNLELIHRASHQFSASQFALLTACTAVSVFVVS